jgi:hypothetical protein
LGAGLRREGEGLARSGRKSVLGREAAMGLYSGERKARLSLGGWSGRTHSEATVSASSCAPTRDWLDPAGGK